MRDGVYSAGTLRPLVQNRARRMKVSKRQPQRWSFSKRQGRLVFLALLLSTGIAVLGGAGAVGVVPAAQADTSATDALATLQPQPPADWTDTTIPMEVEQAVESLGTGTFASTYGGIAVINNQTQLAVYLTTPTAEIESAFETLAPPGMLVFESTPNSLQQIDAIHQQLENEWQSLIAQGIDLVDFGPNPYLGQEDVGVENLTADEAQQLAAQFAPGTLHLYNETPFDVDSRTTQAITRENDNAPYNGGDDISAPAGFCTSGVGVKISGNPRLVSAGHCYDVGANVVNLKSCGFNCTEGSGNAMGSVTNNGLGAYRHNDGSNTLDTLVFTGCNGSGTCGGDGVIWTGAIGNPQRSNVSGIGTWAAGDQVCASGAYGGEKCDFSVAQTGHCAYVAPYNLCGITSLFVTGGDPTIGGDSGGPWFRFSGSNLEITGTHTGYNPNNGLEYFTGINSILNKWNACLITVGFGCVT